MYATDLADSHEITLGRMEEARPAVSAFKEWMWLPIQYWL